MNQDLNVFVNVLLDIQMNHLNVFVNVLLDKGEVKTLTLALQGCNLILLYYFSKYYIILESYAIHLLSSITPTI
jgi:hypothetical protein